jgi:type IV pilus assembly protein PilC
MIQQRNILFKGKDEALFLVRLSFLLRSGAGLVSALSLFESQIKSKSRQKRLKKVISSIDQGALLSKSFREEVIVSHFSIRLIEIGELTGKLPEMLAYAGKERTKHIELRRKIIGSLIYPAIVTVATFSLAIFLTAYIFPKILPLFESVKMKLPLSTQILLFAYDLIHDYGLWIAICVFVFSSIGIILIKKHAFSRFAFHTALLKIPYIGRLLQDYILATFSRVLGLLLIAGITLPDAIKHISDTLFHVGYQFNLKKAETELNHGATLGNHFSRFPALYPQIFSDMVRTGEEAGTLGEVLTHLTELYENDLDTLTKNLPTTLEPILMVIMGSLVGFIAISIISPIYQITQNIKH